MSSYVERVLQPGEEVRHLAVIHWITYVPGFCVLVIGLAVLMVGRAYTSGGFWTTVWEVVSAILVIISAIMIFHAWFDRWITEIAVTNRRVIYKTGFIRRETNEMHMDKVESVKVDQSILGRIFNYGDVTVLGTGEGFETIRTIAAPIELRNHITGI